MPTPLQDLLYRVPLLATRGAVQRQVQAVQFDSRRVAAGGLFVAVPGTQVDGHDYIAAATTAGASVVVCERLPDVLEAEVTYVQVQNSARALGLIAANYYGNPSEQLQLVGVTGTNGKTTVATLLYKLLRSMGHPAGLLSTVAIEVDGVAQPATHTTPDALAVQQLLADMVTAGCSYVCMEVSSHAVVQERIAGLHFAGGIFTNLTHDHLDYHGTFEAYRNAKKAFFDGLPSSAFALSNRDDRNGPFMLQNTAARKTYYSLQNQAEHHARVLESRIEGQLLDHAGTELWLQLPGRFNAYNALAVIASALELGLPKEEVLLAASQLTGARGRFEVVHRPGFAVGVIDYAHTPDALQNVLDTLNDLHEGRGKIYTLVGCGGDRDRAKRPIMAKIAAEASDQVILTSDNPRTEDPEAILDEMERGVPHALVSKVLRISNRREAIRTAARMAQPQDVILIAGKGHETYQEVHGVRHPFDDREEFLNALNLLGA